MVIRPATQRWFRRAWGCVALLPLAFGACQAQSPPAGDEQNEARLVLLIRAEIGEASCTSDADCRTLGVGERACGGPASWQAWSRSISRPERLTELSSELAALQRTRQAKSGMLSTCQYFPDPGALCRAQRCVTRSATNAD